MSIIQDALRKAQNEYIRKDIPPLVKEEAVLPKKIKAAVPRAAKKPVSISFSAIAVILIILFLVYTLTLSSRYSRTPEKNKDAAAVVLPAAKTTDVSTLSKIEPVNFIKPETANFVLNGIMYVENRPQAIINGYILEEGDKINGATVLIIEKDCVLLDLDNTNIRLDLGRQR